LTVLTALLAAWRAAAHGVEAPWGAVLQGGALLWLRSAVAAALTLFVCTFSRSGFFAGGAGLLAVLVGHLRPSAEAAPLDWSAQGLLHCVIRLWPNLRVFEPTEAAAMTGGLVAYGLVWVGLFAAAAMLVFRKREI